jgi:cell wall-associated NlpC family hydrolase
MSLAGFKGEDRILGHGLLAGVLLMLVLTGCSPKRVLRATPPEALPDPEYRGATGNSSLESSTARGSGIRSPEPPGAEPLTGSRLGQAAAALAREQLGKPYQWGAEGPDKFDCSGLVIYVYSELGVDLPRVSGQQAYAGTHVDRKDLQPGDLVFFRLNGSEIDHVGIYVGRSRFVHAPRRYQPVKTESLNNSYWGRKFTGGRRLG